MDDALSDPDVKEERNANSVDEVPSVVRRGASDVEVGQSADDGYDSRQRLDRAKRIAKGAWYLPNIRGGERGLSDLMPRATNRHVERSLRDRCRLRGRLRRRRLGGGLRGDRTWRGRRRLGHARRRCPGHCSRSWRRRTVRCRRVRCFVLVELDARADPGGNRCIAAASRREAPSQHRGSSLLGEGLRAFHHLGARDRSILLDRQLDEHHGIATRVGRIGYVCAARCDRRDQRRGDLCVHRRRRH
jgi:hypothetical protein